MAEPTSESLKLARPSRLCCPIVELRQYTLHPGKRDVLIDLFEREFIETQEAVGIEVIGQFRNVDDRDRFVWLRGFRDMASRAKALQDFMAGLFGKRTGKLPMPRCLTPIMSCCYGQRVRRPDSRLET
jgi:hypothetical protein